MDPALLNQLLSKLSDIAAELSEVTGVLREQENAKTSNPSIITLEMQEEDKTEKKKEVDELATKKDEILSVRIVGIDADAIKILKENFKPTNEKPEEGGFFSKIVSLLGIGAGVLAAFQGPGVPGDIMELVTKLVSKVTSFITEIIEPIIKPVTTFIDDVLSGFSETVTESIGKIFGVDGLKIAEESVAKVLPEGGKIVKMFTSFGEVASKFFKKGLKVFKFIPGIGELVDLYFAYERFEQGDTIGALLNLVGAIPGIGIIFDVLSLARDLVTTDEQRIEQSRSGENMIMKMIKGIGNLVAEKTGKLFSKGFKSLKFIPGLGIAVDLYLAWESYEKGDYIGSILNLAGSIPGFGWIADVLSVARDLTFTEDQKTEQSSSATGSISKMLSGIGTLVADSTKSIMDWGSKVVSGAWTKISAWCDSIREAFTSIIGDISITDVVNDAGTELEDLIDTTSTMWKQKREEIFASLKSVRDSFVEGIQNSIKATSDFLGKSVSAAKNWAINTKDALSHTIGSISGSVSEWATSAFENVRSAVGEIHKDPEVPNSKPVAEQLTRNSNDDLTKAMFKISETEMKLMETQNGLIEQSNKLLAEIRDKLSMSSPKSAGDEDEYRFPLMFTTGNTLQQMNATGYM